MDNYPLGASNDPRAPWNEPLTKEVSIEVGVELGTIITLDLINTDDFKKELEEVLIKKFNIDNDHIILNNYTIYNINK